MHWIGAELFILSLELPHRQVLVFVVGHVPANSELRTSLIDAPRRLSLHSQYHDRLDGAARLSPWLKAEPQR